jgi:hypothetical protein
MPIAAENQAASKMRADTIVQVVLVSRFAWAMPRLTVFWYVPSFWKIRFVPSASETLNSPVSGTVTVTTDLSDSVTSTVALTFRVLTFAPRLAIRRALRSALFVLLMLILSVLRINSGLTGLTIQTDSQPLGTLTAVACTWELPVHGFGAAGRALQIVTIAVFLRI